MKTEMIFLIVLICLTTPVLGVGILPSDMEVGTLNTNEMYNFSFTLTNSYPYNLNITFETLTKDLEPYVSFNPKNLILEPADRKVPFEVIINPEDIQSGNHTLIFKPKVEVEKPEINYTDRSVAGIIVPTATGTISFEIPTKEIPTRIVEKVTEVRGPSYYIYTVKYKDLEIEVPWLVEATEVTSVTIRVKNTGNVSLENLTINLTSKPKLDLKYNKSIGSLSPGEEKNIVVVISNYTNPHHFVKVIASDLTRQWKSAFIIYAPEIPRVSIPADCIVSTPQNFTIEANKMTQINLNIKNLCNFSLHNVNVMIEGIGFIKHFDVIEKELSTTIDVELPKGTYYYEIMSIYDEGQSKSVIKIDSILTPEIYFIIALVIIIGLMVILLFYRRTKKLFLLKQKSAKQLKKERNKLNKKLRILEQNFKEKLIRKK